MRRGEGGDASEALGTLDLALATARELREGLYEAELHRRRGRCLLNAGDVGGGAQGVSSGRVIPPGCRGRVCFARRATEDLAALPAAKPRKRGAGEASLAGA